MIKSYRDLEVWQKAMDLVILCYKITEKFPKNEVVIVHRGQGSGVRHNKLTALHEPKKNH